MSKHLRAKQMKQEQQNVTKPTLIFFVAKEIHISSFYCLSPYFNWLLASDEGKITIEKKPRKKVSFVYIFFSDVALLLSGGQQLEDEGLRPCSPHFFSILTSQVAMHGGVRHVYQATLYSIIYGYYYFLCPGIIDLNPRALLKWDSLISNYLAWNCQFFLLKIILLVGYLQIVVAEKSF